MDVAHQLVSIFCEIDDVCNELDTYSKHKLLPDKMADFGRTSVGW